MLLQFREQRAVGGLPQAHAAIIAATGQARPVRTPRHFTYPGRGVCLTYPPALTWGHLPHLHPLRIPPTGQKLSLRTRGSPTEEGSEPIGVPHGPYTRTRPRVATAPRIIAPSSS